ncbi:hypothetical protein SanaruYs_03670 [Chryseotalea sanaruensis]|uniref:Outer membrane protein beta-barrel domain-containing protein n=1 Tax=Chryseotalea sanaruensis TaxID=2482724 RepID=A0A401U5K1_9BACT|nr:DUF6588 family protein [Chryseotalea sanaruensis]GCC50152.1 hypothetical protein SanaruYs_03670 [Chryseotalea sanaruensis]
MKPIAKILALSVMMAGAQTGFAQGDLGELLRGSQADAKYLAEGYISPFLRTYAAGINQGWYNTAKPHKIGGIDFTLSAAMVTIPGADRTYTVDNSRLNNIYLTGTTSGGAATGTGSVPTIFGKAAAPTYASKDPNTDVPIPGTNFDGPQGTDVFDDYLNGRVPVPVFNAGIGLPKGFELKVRWTPEIDFGDGQIKMIGFGVLHDIKQHIPGIKMLPFDLSAMIAYSKMDIGVAFNDDGSQRGEFTVQGTSVQAIISKKISVLTPYAAIGFGTGTSSLSVKGQYDLDGNGSTETKDPVSVEEKVVSPRMTAGLRLKLLILTIHADYTLQKYSTLTVGLGLSVR